mmetsp:Transcript_27014/g.49051  ORF Transcript_27014/g.49051 Transcript_27014/m.49051 type:complete len:308 (+) Transcript_27014:839-1762(+)
MHILQNAVRWLINRVPKVGIEPVIPCCFKVSNCQIIQHQSALQIEAQHDVQIILHLIRLGPDIAVVHSVHRAEKRLSIRDAKIPKLGLHLLIEPACVGSSAPHLVLVNPALAFMHAHRHATPKRRQKIRVINALLIGRVSDFVNGGVETVERIALAGARGDAHIFARSRAERVCDTINASMIKVIPKTCRQLGCQRHLLVRCKLPCEFLWCLCCQNGRPQRHQTRPHRVKHRRDLCRGHLWFIIIHHGVIDIATSSQRLTFLPLKVYHLFESWQKPGHIFVRSRLRPDALRPAGYLSNFRSQIRWYL